MFHAKKYDGFFKEKSKSSSYIYYIDKILFSD